MKGLIITLCAVLAMSLIPAVVGAGTDQTGAAPPISQPLVREGALAVKLIAALNLGTTGDEAQAEGILTTAGIAPRNGWIADYPVTPDIVGELRSAVADASDANRLRSGRDASLKTFDDVIADSQLEVSTDASGQVSSDAAEQDPSVINNYYYNDGPPVVTYYAPPPDYAYLYTWVSYPFWWSTFWFPGFFVLVDFDRFEFHGHHRHHFSNHVFDRRDGRFFSVNPATRANGGRFTGNDRARVFNPSLSGRAAAGGRSMGGVNGGARQFSTSPTRTGGATNVTPVRSYQTVPRGAVSQPAIRQPMTTPVSRGASVPHAMNRTYTAPSGGGMPGMHSYMSGGGGRSITAPLGGGWSGGHSFSGGFSGSGGRSLGGGWRR